MICRILATVGTNSGHRQGWLKYVTKVDPSKTNGYAFEGEFLRAGALVDLPQGAVLVACDPTGSVRNGGKDGSVRVVEKSSEDLDEAAPIVFSTGDWYSNFLSLRDKVSELLSSESQVLMP